MSNNNVPVTVAHGEGIGPEIMAARLQTMEEAGTRIDIETIEIGEKVYLRGGNAASFVSENRNGPVTHSQIVKLPDRLQQAGLDFIKIENLYTFDGQKGFVASQGE